MSCTRTLLTMVCIGLALPALAQSPKLADGKARRFSRDICGSSTACASSSTATGSTSSS